ncbi:HIT family protein [Arthrobacter agilis]|uniref:HIT family protein n=1 Tax=Arthrobacter agilis TaxID=37921 RepID=UPI000B3503BC|nr:HIT family protein [Arthrobacter agilis]OUM44069.1 diadenosine tetraphosphate hydrolase [Arthrobacter agilis]PPB46445.1 HIT family protein [Arthrobacter agilis]TPV23900.1 HIT family protein [Arthrobacter agilis]VDR32646.1 purine nucleoside phosphoramidase [Arthrobacter agilis]
MPTLFTRIIDGEIPGRFVWQDDVVVAFLTIAPITPGHTLVVPRREIEHWLEADAETLAKVMAVAQTVGRAQEKAFGAQRVGVLLEGYEVPHLHVHVWPTQSPADFDVKRVDPAPDPSAMDEAAEALRAALRAAGHGESVPG